MRRWKNSRSNSIRDERGVALTEFVITAPFLLIMCAGVVDIGMVLGQYIRLSEAVHTGLRLATSYSQLESGTFRGLSAGQGASCLPQGTSESHQAVQQRVEELIGTNNRRADLTTLCITSSVDPSAIDPTKNLVKVTATIEYQAILPVLLSRIPITVEASGPMLD